MFHFGQKVLHWIPKVKEVSVRRVVLRHDILSKAPSLRSYPGCYKVWDEAKDDMVIAADVKPLTLLPGVDVISQEQEHTLEEGGRLPRAYAFRQGEPPRATAMLDQHGLN